MSPKKKPITDEFLANQVRRLELKVEHARGRLEAVGEVLKRLYDEAETSFMTDRDAEALTLRRIWHVYVDTHEIVGRELGNLQMELYHAQVQSRNRQDRRASRVRGRHGAQRKDR